MSSRPCLSVSTKKYHQQGPFAPPALPGFTTTTDPSATLTPPFHFPVSSVIGTVSLRGFRPGAWRASPVALRVLVTVPPSYTPPEWVGRVNQIAPTHAAFAITQKARPPDLIHFGATLRSLALRPGDSLTAPENGFVDELQMLGFPHTCHPSYGGLASTPAGFTFLLNTLAFIGHTEFLDITGHDIAGHGFPFRLPSCITCKPGWRDPGVE